MANLAVPLASNVVTSGPPHRAILRLALPTVGAMLAQSIVNEIDVFFFAKLPNPESSNAQAALLPSLIILWLFGGSLSGIAVGTQTFTARRFAEKDDEAAGAVLTNAFTFAFVVGGLFSFIGYVAMGPILDLLIKSDGAHQAAHDYLQYRLLGVMSMAATFAFKAFFDGIGKTSVHFVASIVMNAFNIGLCLLLIFGNSTLGLPKMGIAGAGLSGVISTYVGLAIMAGYALKSEYRKRFRPLSLKKLDKSLMWNILKLSIPGAVATVVIMLGFAMFSMIGSSLDNGSVEPVNSASMTVIVAVLKLTFTACLAFGTATATLVSQSLGEKQPDKAERFGWASVRLGLIIFGIVGLAEAIFAPQILHLVASSPAVEAHALLPMRIMGLATPLIATALILTQALFGAGNTLFVMIVEFCLHFLCLVPLAYLLGVSLHMGLVGLFLAAVAYVTGLASAMFLKFRSGGWKRIKI